MKLLSTLLAAAAANTCSNTFWQYDGANQTCEPTSAGATIACSESAMTLTTDPGLWGGNAGDFTFQVGSCGWDDPTVATEFDFASCGAASSTSDDYGQIEKMTMTSVHTANGHKFYNDVEFTCNIDMTNGAEFDISVAYNAAMQTAYVSGTVDNVVPENFVTIEITSDVSNIKVAKEVDWKISSSREITDWTLSVVSCKVTSQSSGDYTAPSDGSQDFQIFHETDGAQTLVGADLTPGSSGMGIVVGDLWTGKHIEFQFSGEPDTGMNHLLSCTLRLNRVV